MLTHTGTNISLSSHHLSHHYPFTMTPSTASFSSFELVESHVEPRPVETLCVKESATASSELAEVVRPSTSNPVLTALCAKEPVPAPTWQETATAWRDLQLAVAEERTHLERVALRQSSTSPLPIPLVTDLPPATWDFESPTWHLTLSQLPGWMTPPAAASDPVPQIAQRTGPIRGEKKRFSPRMKSGGKQPRTKKRSQICFHCGSVDHGTEECAFAKVEPELPPLMKKAQELPKLTLLEKVALMRSAEWTPEICGSCWRRNPGHREQECPQKEKCLKCGGMGPYGYIHRHVCRIWPGDADVFMDEDEDYEYWSRYE
jgi:hypothetical protein